MSEEFESEWKPTGGNFVKNRKLTLQIGNGEAQEAAISEPAENGVAKVNGTSEVKENGLTEEEAVRDPSVFRETREKEEIHFAEMNNYRQKFESGKIDDREPEPKRRSVKDEYDAGGEYENEPVPNPDVIREVDHPTEDLPEAGSTKNLLSKFKTIQEEKAQTVRSQKRESPPRQEKVEYESTPTEHLVIEAGKSDAGEFESTPKDPEGVVRSGDILQDAQPEKGYAKNMLNKFKEIQSGTAAPQPRERREITPDRSGKVEYVSEPRGQRIEYDENRVDAGVFENQPKGEEEDVVRAVDRPQEMMPESGMARNLLSKFKQMESEAGNRPPPSPKREVREITPDRSGKVEYVSEPRGSRIEYEEQKEDQGVFESKPSVAPEVVRSGDMLEDYKPEAGTAKKTLERYKEMQKQSSSPVSSPPRKEITPPRDTTSPGKTVHGVIENTPSEARGDVVRSGDRLQDELPEHGSARNILNKFREIQSTGSSPAASPTKKPKEFTPPPEAGIYENTPSEHLIIEPQKSFEGVLESTPAKSHADVAREYEHSPEKELPETGMAKNLVSKFRQLETSSAKTSSSTSPRFKEFTPPRDRGPLSPKSPAGGPSDGVNLSDLPGQYQQQDKPGVYENEPEVKPDVYREADTDFSAGLPAPNTTASMLQKFRSIQEHAKEEQTTPTPVTRKEETPPPQDSEEKGMFKVVQTEKCDACQKTVYAMEKLEMNHHVYHKNCFKCSHCSARLTPKTFSMNEGVIYCVNHFKQLFARKGNYDEGFGRQQYKKKWQDSKKEVASA